MKLDNDLLEEAAWILEQGVIKGDQSTAELMRSKFVEGPLAAVMPDAVDLP